MNPKHLLALLGATCVSASAIADFTELTTERRQSDITDIENLYVCSVYANFDDADDILLSVGFGDIASSTGAFYQHGFGQDTAPLDFLIEIYPVILYDSFVTVGVTENDGGDTSTPDPDFDRSAFNNDGLLLGGWFNSYPSNGQGDPIDGRVLIAQLSIQNFAPGDEIGGSMTVFWKDGDTGDVIGSDVSFLHAVPAPGVLTALAIFGLVRRRHRSE